MLVWSGIILVLEARMAALFETKYAGSRVSVFPTHVEWKMLGQSKVIPLNSISSVEHGIDFALTITTTGGDTIKIPTKKKKELQAAILQAMAGL